MIGKLTCALVRMFGGKHDFKRLSYKVAVPVRDEITGEAIHHANKLHWHRVCRRCGYAPPKRVYKRKEKA